MVIKAGRPPSLYKYSQRKNAYTLVGQQSIHLTGVDRYDHGNYSCKAVYLTKNFEHKEVQKHVMLLVKGEFILTFPLIKCNDKKLTPMVIRYF